MFRARWAEAFLCVAASVTGCSNDAKDAHCSPDTPDYAADPSCIYAGTGKGPVYEDPECPDVEGDPPAQCPSFYDVLEVFADPERGNCSASGCHGNAATAQTLIFLPIADPFLFYDNLLEAEGTVGTPYVVADDPATPELESRQSWIVCNLHGERGFPMPPPSGMPELADIDVVHDWVLCGAPPPETCEAVETDGECVACVKASCCNRIVQCRNDATCDPCLMCLQDNDGDVSACSAECDLEAERVDLLVSCASNQCETECPAVGK